MAFNKYITASPAVVCIGGGTGMSTMLRGLKNYVKDITAIVTVSDDGGGSGVLRDELGMPPPGDIRNCIQALSNTEPTMEKLWSYRFESGSLKGQCFGNLLLAAMNGISESFEDAVAKVSDVLAITGRVLPVTDEDVNLKAELEDGSSVVGESAIARQKRIHGCRIKRVSLVPERPPALYSCVNAIEKADMIILGPGSLYTSVIPNLLVEGIAQAIMASDAIKVYLCNVMTQPGETENYTASDHIRAVFAHGGKLFDYCLVNDAPAEPTALERYGRKGAEPVTVDAQEIEKLGVIPVLANVAGYDNSYYRHNPWLLAAELIRLYGEKSQTRVYKTGRK